MISDFETNTVYLSQLMATDERFISTFNHLKIILKEFGTEVKLIPLTKDIWARDYMPIQINDNTFVEYRYDPDYLQGNRKGYRSSKTYPDIVCDALRISTTKSDLIMDGGNVVKSRDCIILTDKIVQENKHAYTLNELTKKLQDTFQVDKVVLIPWDKLEPYGHSDGMLRFIDSNRVLVNHLYVDDTALSSRLKRFGLKAEFLKLKTKTNSALNWAYVNFLQTKDFMIVPKFGITEDIEALDHIENLFENYYGRIAQVDMNATVQFSGALNCVTWTTKE